MLFRRGFSVLVGVMTLRLHPTGDAATGAGDAAGILTMLRTPSACVVGATYLQNAVDCPTPVCGNGIQETGEACDDGNRTDDDRCHNDCTPGLE